MMLDTVAKKEAVLINISVDRFSDLILEILLYTARPGSLQKRCKFDYRWYPKLSLTWGLSSDVDDMQTNDKYE